MVVETPPETLGMIDDMWFRWVIDFGLPGPDRGQGGNYLIVPPGYDGPLPDSGYYVGRPDHDHGRACSAARFSTTTIRSRPSRRSRSTLKIYPYVPGGLWHQHRPAS